MHLEPLHQLEVVLQDNPEGEAPQSPVRGERWPESFAAPSAGVHHCCQLEMQVIHNLLEDVSGWKSDLECQSDELLGVGGGVQQQRPGQGAVRRGGDDGDVVEDGGGGAGAVTHPPAHLPPVQDTLYCIHCT